MFETAGSGGGAVVGAPELESALLPVDVDRALGLYRSAVDALIALDLSGLNARQLLATLVSVETTSRRVPVVDQALIAAIETQGVAHELCVPNTAALLRDLLRVSAREAAGRVRAAADLGPRRELSGAPLAPIFARVAAAQAAGTISVEHARVITTAVEDLPYAVQAEHGTAVEADLVAYAGRFDPQQLGKLAKRMLDCLDPDGILTEDADQQRRRGLSLSLNTDGSYTVRGRLTPVCGAVWAPILDSLSRPAPAVDGLPDARTSPVRTHDGFQDAGLRLLRSDLPECAGAPVRLILTMTATQAVTGTGHAHTGNGALVPVFRALDLTEDVEVTSVLFDPHGGVLDYGTSRRLVPPKMRYALIARDKGCTFPNCDRPPSYCEAHHFREHTDHGPTSLSNTALVCGFHHREFARHSWRSVFIGTLPHWIPPPWRDPTQTPLTNTTHNTQLREPEADD